MSILNEIKEFSKDFTEAIGNANNILKIDKLKTQEELKKEAEELNITKSNINAKLTKTQDDIIAVLKENEKLEETTANLKDGSEQIKAMKEDIEDRLQGINRAIEKLKISQKINTIKKEIDLLNTDLNEQNEKLTMAKADKEDLKSKNETLKQILEASFKVLKEKKVELNKLINEYNNPQNQINKVDDQVDQEDEKDKENDTKTIKEKTAYTTNDTEEFFDPDTAAVKVYSGEQDIETSKILNKDNGIKIQPSILIGNNKDLSTVSEKDIEKANEWKNLINEYKNKKDYKESLQLSLKILTYLDHSNFNTKKKLEKLSIVIDNTIIPETVTNFTNKLFKKVDHKNLNTAYTKLLLEFLDKHPDFKKKIVIGKLLKRIDTKNNIGKEDLGIINEIQIFFKKPNIDIEEYTPLLKGKKLKAILELRVI